MMEFSELTLERAILEVRYPTTFLFWDNSGKTMSLVTQKFPKIELRDAQVSNVQSDWWEEGLTLNFNQTKADVTQDFPKNLDNFKMVCDELCEAIRNVLEVKSFGRVGVRYIFVFPRESIDAARDFFLRMSLVSLNAEKLQSFLKGEIEEQQTLVRYEDEDRGYAFRLSHTPRELSFRLSRPFTLDASRFHKNGIIFDIDCYTKKPLEAPAFVAKDFVRLTYRTIEEHLLSALGL